MFDQVKVNQNSIINLLKIPERENSDILTKKPGNDFYSMVMEKNDYNNRPYQTAELQKNTEQGEPAKNEQFNKAPENPKVNGGNGRGTNSSSGEKNIQEHAESDSLKHETKNSEVKKNSDSQVKDVKDKKNSHKESDEEKVIIDQLHGENNIKKLMEIIRAAFSGNKKAEDENFQKLFSSLKIKHEKDNTGLASSLKKNNADRNTKSTPELLSVLTKELKSAINKELFKNMENRKSGSKPQMLTDKELKELASTIIESIKKNKAKDIVKHEARIASPDDARNDKKPVIQTDQPVQKKIEISDDSSFEKNGSRDKNSSRDSFSYNGGKVDFSAKSGLEKMEHTLKASDFKENLQEIIDKAKVTVRDSRNGAFTVRLNPQELGNVNVNLIMENGVITGKFLVDNEDAKGMLLNSLNDLKFQMEEAGIAVGEFSVNVSDQREKYLMQKDDEGPGTLPFVNSDKEVIAAVDQYSLNAAAHTGHINMVI